MISCEKATTICCKTQYREAGFRERLQLWFHLLSCRQCAAFSRKNRALTEVCRKASIKHLSPEEKAAMKERLKTS